jgi:tetratricopeptide (TPR) repeat protein
MFRTQNNRNQRPERRTIPRATALLAFYVLVSAICVASTRSNTAIKSFNQGVEFLNKNDYQNATDSFSEAIAADDGFAEAYYLRGVCRYQLKGLDGALLDLSDAIRLKEDLIEARGLRGLIRYESDQYDQALEDLNAVLEKKPKDAQARLIRGIISLKREDSAAAVRDFKVFLAVKPDDPMAPQVREVLASLTGAPAAKPSSDSAADVAPAAPRKHAASQRAAPEDNSLTPQVSTRELADRFGKQLLHGEQTQASGDLNRRVPVSDDGTQH